MPYRPIKNCNASKSQLLKIKIILIFPDKKKIILIFSRLLTPIVFHIFGDDNLIRSKNRLVIFNYPILVLCFYQKVRFIIFILIKVKKCRFMVIFFILDFVEALNLT